MLILILKIQLVALSWVDRVVSLWLVVLISSEIWRIRLGRVKKKWTY